MVAEAGEFLDSLSNADQEGRDIVTAGVDAVESVEDR
jgi:hypothetical protein